MLELISRIVSLFLGVVATILLLAALNACLSIARAAEPLPDAVGALTFDNEPFCTAALVGPRVALTAAHCLDGHKHSDIELFVGPDTTAPKEIASVTAILPHPGYEPDSHHNDIARIIVEPPLDTHPLPVTRPRKGLMRLVDHGPKSPPGGETVEIHEIDETTLPFSSWRSSKHRCLQDTGGLILDERDGDYALAGVASWNCGRLGGATRADTYQDLITSPCGGERWEGRCVGNTATWCEEGEVQTWDCTEDEMFCRWDPDLGLASCNRGD